MKVLAAIDRDPPLDDLLAALRWEVRLTPEDEIHLLHVVPESPWLQRRSNLDPVWASELAALPAKADRMLDEAVADLESAGLRATKRRTKGDPAHEILQATQDERPDLLVLGAGGKTGLENFLLGSVSQKVKLHAHCDTLLVRPRESSPRERFAALIAVDGSEESLLAVESFVRKMQVVLAEPHLLHVQNHPGEDEPSTDRLPRTQDAAEEAVAKAKTLLEAEGLACTSERRHGRPASAILAAAKERRCQLIVMGARGLSPISRFLMGSVSQRVIRHAGCAVLCARKPDQASG